MVFVVTNQECVLESNSELQFITGHTAIINTQRLIDGFWYTKCFTAPEQTIVCSGNDNWNFRNCASTRYDYCQDRLIIKTPFKTCYWCQTLNWTESPRRNEQKNIQKVSLISQFIHFLLRSVRYAERKQSALIILTLCLKD